MPYPIKTHTKNNKEYIFDAIRKKDILLTPEEWVRQHFIQYMVDELNYPLGSIAVEKTIKIGLLQKRYDIIVYKEMQPWMLIECKSEKTTLNKDVLLQSLNYNTTLKTSYIVLTNLMSIYCLSMQDKDSNWLNHMPKYE